MHIAILLDDLSGGGVERSMLTLAGGYAVDVQDTVDIQTTTVETLLKA